MNNKVIAEELLKISKAMEAISKAMTDETASAPAKDVAPTNEVAKAKADASKTASAVKTAPKSAKVDEPKDDEGEVAPAPAEYTLQDKVEAELKDYSEQEIADLLDSVGVKPVGKRQALIAKVVKAVQDGIIELEVEGGEPTSDEAPSNAVNSDEEPADGEESAYPSNEDYNRSDEITEERAEAMRIAEKSVRTDYKTKKLTDKTIAKAVTDFYLDGEPDFDADAPAKDKLELYVDATLRMIDDEGNTVEPGEPYALNGVDACCGHYLAQVEGEDALICEVCGNEYQSA